MIKFILSESKEQQIINRLQECRRVQINITISEAVVYYKHKHKNYKMNEIYCIVGNYAGVSGNRVKQIYNQAPKTNA